jgi:hypothetical protein
MSFSRRRTGATELLSHGRSPGSVATARQGGGGGGGLDVRRGNCFSSLIPVEFIAARVKRRYRGPIDGAGRKFRGFTARDNRKEG